jgi:Do/DeqQ family serine protease
MKLYRVFTFLFTSIATGLAAAFIVLLLRPDLLQDGIGGLQEKLPAPMPMSGPVSYADAVAHAAPAVVNVFATKITRQNTHPLFNEPLLQRYFGDEATRPRFKRENSLGSGVIVDSNGYILTNNHVISGASEIQVVLNDGRQMPARIVGSDPESDLAVLQAAGDKLPVATLGESQNIRVGDVVMAIGNPFGVGQTVTLGIVSATGRNQLGITDFENFIQTDAAINPGNSGGALINTRGEVVGINTAIFSDSGGSHGIGFAIPIKLAKSVLTEIAKHGRVIRGWIGVSAQQLTPELADSLGIGKDHGLLVNGVLEGGPADRAGLLPGDLILEVDGQRAYNATQMLNLIAGHHPGDKIAVKRNRGGNTDEIQVTVAERPARHS